KTNSCPSRRALRAATSLRTSLISRRVHPVQSVVRTLETDVTRQNSAHDVTHIEEQCALRINSAHHAGLAPRAIDYRHSLPGQGRKAFPLRADGSKAARHDFHIAIVEQGEKRIRNRDPVTRMAYRNPKRGCPVA